MGESASLDQSPRTVAAMACSMVSRASYRVRHREPCCMAPAAVDLLNEASPVDQKQTPSQLDRRIDVALRDIRRQLGQRSGDRRLPATVVERRILRGEKPKCVPRPSGEQPVIQCGNVLAGLLEPTGGAGVERGRVRRRPARQFGQKPLPNQ